jgi:hypothetical protein
MEDRGRARRYKRSWRRAAVAAAGAVAVAVVLPACGPAMSTRPAIPFEDGMNDEFDLAGTAGIWMPLEGTGDGWPAESDDVVAAGQLSYYHQFDNPFGFGLVAFAGSGGGTYVAEGSTVGDSSFLGGAGVIFRFRLTEPGTPVAPVEPQPDLDADPAEQARELAEIGAERAAAGRCGEALGLFERAEELAPERSLQHAVALCRCQLGNFAGALSALETSLRQRGDRLSPAQRTRAEEWRTRLQAAAEALATGVPTPPTSEVCPALPPPPAGSPPSTPPRLSTRQPGFGAAAELTAGYLWAEGAFPLAVRLAPWLWLYTAPGLGVSVYPFLYVRVPFGFALRIASWSMILMEFSPRFDVLASTAYLHGGLGLAFRF